MQKFGASTATISGACLAQCVNQKKQQQKIDTGDEYFMHFDDDE